MIRLSRQTIRKLTAVAIMATVVSAFAWPGCDKKPAVPASADPAVIVISGDTGPWIVPCGCAANQAGGLARRASFLHQQGSDVLYLDAGGAAAGDSEYFRLKFGAVLAGEKLMNIAAHNLGKAELQVGRAELDRLRKLHDIPFVSANTRYKGIEIAPGIRLLAANGKRIAVVGVVSPKFATAEIAVSDPRQAVTDAVAPAKGQYDSLIVLAYLPEDELSALAAALPEADAVIGGPTGQAISPRPVGPTLLASATNKGKFLIKLTAQPKGWNGEVIEVAHTYAEDARQMENLKEFLQTLDAADIPASETGLVQSIANAPASYAIAGSESCVACHQAEADAWTASKHHHAGETLKARGFHVDAYCLQCHSTGFGLPGGFTSPQRTPKLSVVGCESCHGPSAAHVKEPTVRTTFNAFDQCIRCHDQENSPTFNRDVYWDRIKHGKKYTGAPK